MLLKDLVENINAVRIDGSLNIPVEGICFDSRKVKDNYLFIAINGTQTNGHKYIDIAIKAGAIAIVYDENIDVPENTTCIKVKDSSYASGIIASSFYNKPSEKLKLVGITGTNGKTTIATLLFNLFRQSGYKCGLISTIRYKVNETEHKASHTTPDQIQLNYLLKQMVDEGCEYCFMEVSSHSVVQNRISGIKFKGAVFTNITHDHLDYHKTFNAYIKAKKGFFDMLGKDSFALVNVDDRNSDIMIQNAKAIKKTYGLLKEADFKAKVLQNDFSGLHLQIDNKEVWFKLFGIFNAYNLLAIYSTSVLLGMDKEEILSGMSLLNPVEGRFEYVKSEDNITSIIDYAHTPDALTNVINTILKIKNKSQSLISVVGCGGDRDKAKRPVMAKIASDNSDRTILTSDNPRNEEPETIISEMEAGIDNTNKSKVLSIVNRKEAIKTAIALAKSGDIILIAGKGHENYQEIKGIKYYFNDKEIVKEFFRNK